MRYIYILLLIFTFSCKSQQTKDGAVSNPTKNIKWIKKFINETNNDIFPTKAQITQYTYKGETVYLVEHCYECPDAAAFLYNVKKEKLCTFGGMVPNTNNCPNFSKEATNEKVIWKNFK